VFFINFLPFPTCFEYIHILVLYSNSFLLVYYTLSILGIFHFHLIYHLNIAYITHDSVLYNCNTYPLLTHKMATSLLPYSLLYFQLTTLLSYLTPTIPQHLTSKNHIIHSVYTLSHFNFIAVETLRFRSCKF
jgi:hypothetical protein